LGYNPVARGRERDLDFVFGLDSQAYSVGRNMVAESQEEHALDSMAAHKDYLEAIIEGQSVVHILSHGQ
jgi:hypothetical protein